MENKHEEERVQELIDYSLQVHLLKILLENNELSKVEYDKIKNKLKKEHLKYLDNIVLKSWYNIVVECCSK